MILAPGATIGILGAGQLGRMLAIAALKIGLRCHIYAPEAEAPAYDAATRHDGRALTTTRRRCGASPTRSTSSRSNSRTCRPRLRRVLEPALKPVRPGARALALTQDRLIEKNFLRDLGLETAPFVGVEDSGALVRAVAELGRPSILKTRRFGYDGKGQAMIREGSNVSARASHARRRRR